MSMRRGPLGTGNGRVRKERRRAMTPGSRAVIGVGITLRCGMLRLFGRLDVGIARTSSRRPFRR